MLLVRNYLVEGKEYMVLDGTSGFMPGSEAIRLLCSRFRGVGADRVIVFVGTEEIPSFKAFAANGVEEEMTAADYAVLARTKEDYEIRITDYFLEKLRAVDAKSTKSLKSIALAG